jgi:hypothetical protein
MTGTTPTTSAAPASATPTTVADLEQQIAGLDARRRQVSTAMFQGNRAATSSGAQQNPALDAHLRQLALEASEIDAERQAADRRLRQLRKRETTEKAWRAALPVAAEHRQISLPGCRACGRVDRGAAGRGGAARHAPARGRRQRLAELAPFDGGSLVERLDRLSVMAGGISQARPPEPAPAVEPGRERKTSDKSSLVSEEVGA